jgi:hypothetical protein
MKIACRGLQPLTWQIELDTRISGWMNNVLSWSVGSWTSAGYALAPAVMAIAVAPALSRICLNDGDGSPLDSGEFEGISVAAVALVGSNAKVSAVRGASMRSVPWVVERVAEWELQWESRLPAGKSLVPEEPAGCGVCRVSRRVASKAFMVVEEHGNESDDWRMMIGDVMIRKCVVVNYWQLVVVRTKWGSWEDLKLNLSEGN